MCKENNLGFAGGGVRAYLLGAELPELTVSAFLRALVAVTVREIAPPERL